MKIFITHYTPLKERKQYIINQLNNANITDYVFIDAYDKEELTQSDVNKFFGIKPSEISLFLKHIEIYKKCNNDIIIVLEDDAVLVDNFKSKLEYYINISKSLDWDIIFSGECCNLHITNTTDTILYKSYYSRGTCMYILNYGVCNKLISIYNNEKCIDRPIDHWFNYIILKYRLNCFWSEPTLVSQGSEVGIFTSAIR
jgi:GR25 family glycosyltransferase involved in LPS biosynthesis